MNWLLYGLGLLVILVTGFSIVALKAARQRVKDLQEYSQFMRSYGMEE